MKLRTLVLVVGLLLLVSGAVYWLRRPAAPTGVDPRIGQSLVDNAALEKAARLRLTDNGKTVLLARQPDATWRVASYYDFPADFSKISQFVGELSNAKFQRLVTTRPDRLARLDFKGTQISLLDASNKPEWSFDLGKTADAGGRYVRFDNEQKAYLADFNGWIDTDSKNWADTTLVQVKPEDVASVELTFSDGASVHALRAQKGEAFHADNPPAGRQLNGAKLTSLLGSVTGLHFSDTTAPDDAAAQAAEKHTRSVTLKTFDGQTLTVTFARTPEEKKLKPPAPEKGGVASLGTSKDVAKGGEAADGKSAQPAPKVEPEFETTPAGPVFVRVMSSDSAAPINELMKKRAFKIYDYAFTSLPNSPADLFENAPPPAPASAPAGKTPPPAPTPTGATKP